MARIWRSQSNSPLKSSILRLHHIGLTVPNLELAEYHFMKNGFQHEACMIWEQERNLFLTKKTLRIELSQTTVQTELIHFAFEVPSLSAVRGLYKYEDGPYELDNGWDVLFAKDGYHPWIEFIQTT
ncbi:VOC family protein [Mechercharimyces sp. CAU 1602]|uniref:VOC family protein n=1 Tax=Mechercharimyces sp. CAU 1602 TaxID=2973933 RepID=UPI002162B17A|nr:hypothetical protein [Mechercharimyces sp. CAU 1602]MCS1350765.1 hypothetical protein [Mechercharimyces sp. CAU 1602]